jgi:molybdate transport system substrate-binding protein
MGRKSAIVVTTIVGLMVALLLAACGSGAGSTSTSGGAATTQTASPAAIDTSTTQAAKRGGELLVCAASSLKAPFADIGKLFDAKNGSKTTFNFASSGVLQTQVEAGAPADVFASAAPTQVDNLLSKNLVDSPTASPFASNEIVLAVPANSKLGISSFQDLTKTEVKRIATGKPETAPHGKAAIEILTKLGLLDQVKSKLIYAENALQTTQYVAQGEVDAALMFVTDAKASVDKIKIVQTADPSWHSSLTYVMAVVSASKNKGPGQAFIDFVLSPEGQAVLQQYGFQAAPAK